MKLINKEEPAKTKRVRVHTLEWFLDNCHYANESKCFYFYEEYNDRQDLPFTKSMFCNCGKVIELYSGLYQDNMYLSWMYEEIDESKEFQPFQITLEVESVEEARLLWHCIDRFWLEKVIAVESMYNFDGTADALIDADRKICEFIEQKIAPEKI